MYCYKIKKTQQNPKFFKHTRICKFLNTVIHKQQNTNVPHIISRLYTNYFQK